jgi:hypothetical protein
MPTFTSSDGIALSYYVDDSTRPRRKPETLPLPHAAMGSAKRYFRLRRGPGTTVLRMDMRVTACRSARAGQAADHGCPVRDVIELWTMSIADRPTSPATPPVATSARTRR